MRPRRRLAAILLAGSLPVLTGVCTLAQDWARIATETDEPAFGLRLVEIFPDSQAESLGLRVGDYVYQIGNHGVSVLPGMLRQHESTLFYCPANGRKATATIQPGRIGVRWALSFRPQLDYLRGEIGTTDPRWDRRTAAALALLETDPAAAEESWLLARALGYPDDELHAFVRAYCDWRLGRSIPLAEAFEAIHGEFSVMPHFYAALLEHMAHASGRTDLLRRLHEMDPESSLVPASLIENWELADSPPVPQRRLLEYAERLRVRNLNDQLAVPPWEEDERLEGRLALLLDHGFRSPDPGRYNLTKFVLPDGTRDFHCAISFRLATRGFHEHYDGLVRFEALSDEATEELYGTRRLAELTIIANRDGSTQIINRAGHSESRRRYWLHNEPIPFDAEATAERPPQEARPFNIDLVRLGHEIAVYANGVAYAHLPFDPEAPTKWLQLHVSGVTVDITDFQVWSLDED